MSQTNPYGYNPNAVDSYQQQHAQLERTGAFAVFMRNVYTWMTLALVITGLTAYYVSMRNDWLQAIVENRMLFWGLLLAEIGVVIWLSARIHKMSFSTAGLLFGVYALLNGVTMSFIFMAFTKTSIAATFLITAGTFGAMSLVGYFTKRDLSAIGRILLMALIGLIIATVVNLFLGSTTLEMGITYAGVLIFVGLTAYDTQKIKMLLMQYGTERNESTMKIALLGSLTLYLDFINLFLYLLRIFGGRK